MQQQLLILRGLPGSGKSTFAFMLEDNCGFVHFEADMYFDFYCDGKFDPKKLPAAHNWCRQMVVGIDSAYSIFFEHRLFTENDVYDLLSTEEVSIADEHRSSTANL